MKQVKFLLTFTMIAGLAVLFAAALVAAPHAALAAPPPANIPEVTITGTEYSYDAPAQISAGLVAVTFVNKGQAPHQLQFARLQDGKTLNDLQAALKQNLGAAMAIMTFTGGANTVDPGGSQRVVLNLTPGNYVLMCFVEDADGTPHFAKGMIKPIQVVAGNSTAAAAPNTDATVTLQDFSITLPQTINAGSHTWKVVNNGPQPHEMDLLKLAPGKTFADVEAFFQKSPAGPPPFQDVGGMGGLSAGQSGWVNLDLQPGNYVALCFIPDAKTGKPHFELGMSQPFTVPGSSTAAPNSVPVTGGEIVSNVGLWLVAGLLLATGLGLFVGFRLLPRGSDSKGN